IRLQIVARGQAQLGQPGALHGPVRRQLRRPADHDRPGVDRDGVGRQPAAFSVPVCGLSIATRLRSTSISALDFDNGALMRTAIGPFSNPAPGNPSLARAALSNDSDNTAEPSSAVPLAASIATGTPYIWPWPVIFRLLRSA